MEVIESEDGQIFTWQTPERHYWITPKTFTKRELYSHEKRPNIYGKPIIVPWSRERLRNEYEALKFISENTTIPVPRILEYSEEGEVTSLTLETVPGDSIVEDIIEELNADEKERLISNVNEFMSKTVLPQLQSLRSKSLGALCGVVIPPVRVTSKDKRSLWEPRTASTERNVFCHNDLARHNIMVDPKTLEVIAIIDWEYSGFFPPEFEYQFWHKSIAERNHDNEDIDHLIALLEEPGDVVEYRLHNSIKFAQKSFLSLVSWFRAIIGRTRSRVMTWFRSYLA